MNVLSSIRREQAVIGRGCKHGDMFSWPVLIMRRLTSKLFYIYYLFLIALLFWMAIEECLVIIAAGIHPVTFRTRKLSLPAPKILGLSSRENRSSPNFFLLYFFFNNVIIILFYCIIWRVIKLNITLYRKYRPQKFEEIAGQEYVTRAIKNSLR